MQHSFRFDVFSLLFQAAISFHLFQCSMNQTFGQTLIAQHLFVLIYVIYSKDGINDED